jgi:hypothetical protein
MKRQSVGIGLCLEYGQMCRISTTVKGLCQPKGKRSANTGQSVWIWNMGHKKILPVCIVRIEPGPDVIPVIVSLRAMFDAHQCVQILGCFRTSAAARWTWAILRPLPASPAEKGSKHSGDDGAEPAHVRSASTAAASSVLSTWMISNRPGRTLQICHTFALQSGQTRFIGRVGKRSEISGIINPLFVRQS